jgi:hypothetical protein
VNQPVEGVDARTDRVAQGVVGIALLAAFVFRVVWVVPVVAIIVGIAALGGPQVNGLHQAFERWIAPRIPASSSVAVRVPTKVVRAQDALAAGLLVVGSLAFALGIGFVGWTLTLAEAVVAIVAATTGIHLAERLRRRL